MTPHGLAPGTRIALALALALVACQGPHAALDADGSAPRPDAGLDAAEMEAGVDTPQADPANPPEVTPDPGTVPDDPGPWSACTPSCQYDDECGDDGCGGICGECPPDKVCRYTGLGRRCTLGCVDTSDCWPGALCYFGDCADRECTTDADCAANQECWQGFRCQPYLACESDANCPHPGSYPSHYCDAGGRCRDGDCRDDGDCNLGTCGTDHWCVPDQCYGDPWGPCPPTRPVCHVTVDRSCLNDPACTTSACGFPCVRDTECQSGQICVDSMCITRTNECQLDSQCPPGQYCHPGCVDPPTPCGPDGECPDTYACAEGTCPALSACSNGWCEIGAAQFPSCSTDAECAGVFEDVECAGGHCQPRTECLWDAECAPTQICASRLCSPRPDVIHCLVDTDCPADRICVQGSILGDGCAPAPECTYDLQCGEGRACGSDQRCYPSVGLCAFVMPGPGFCDDNDPATLDGCDPLVGCTHAASGQ